MNSPTRIRLLAMTLTLAPFHRVVALAGVATGLTLNQQTRRARFMTTMAAAAAPDDKHYDYLVIGAGSGGMASARRAASYGAKVAIIERSGTQGLGGTCVNVGCVPKKVMFNCATVNEMMHYSTHYGYSNVLENVKFSWPEIKAKRDAYVARLNGIYENNLNNAGITKIDGFGSFAGPNAVKVGDEVYTAKHILIAVGGRTSMPEISGIEHCIDSDGFFELEDKPEKVAVIGAGYIAVELAGIFQALESDTHLFVRGTKALRRFDAMLADTLDSEMKKAGMNIHPGSTPASVTKREDGKLDLTLENGEVHEGFDSILMAIGRQPLVGALDLDKAGVTTKSGGYISVDEFQNTAADNVYALGDVCGEVELTPMAIAAGRRLADRLFDGQADAKADYETVPTVIFSHPTIGTVGLSEHQARETYADEEVKVYTSRFTNLFYGPWQIDPDDKPKTAMKIICVGETERIVGLHVIGMGADEMLQGFGVAMKMGATKADLDSCVAIHPTASEEFVTFAPWGLSGMKK